MSTGLQPFISEGGAPHMDELKKWISGMNDDEFRSTLTRVHPYALTIPPVGGVSAKERTVSFSYTNMTLQSATEITNTAMIGFLYAMASEYKVPEGIKPIPVEDWLRDPKVADTPESVKDTLTQDLYRRNRESMPERAAVLGFLNHLFTFDPKIHAVGAYLPNKNDPSRPIIDTEATRQSMAVGNTVRKSTGSVVDRVPTAAEMTGAGLKTVKPETKLQDTVYNKIPSRDNVERFNRYLNENYDAVLECSKLLYGTDPMYDIALNVYEIHANAEEAKKFKRKHIDDAVAPITNIQTNRWALLGPYRENRDRVDFLNRHNDILKAMLDKNEENAKIGADIVKKRAQVAKARNIKEAGPDHKAFNEFVKNNKPDVAGFGATRLGGGDTESKGDEKSDAAVESKDGPLYGGVVTRKPVETKKREKGDHSIDESKASVGAGAGAAADADDCPKDMVEISVFKMQDGGARMEVEKLYNPVEAPSDGKQ